MSRSVYSVRFIAAAALAGYVSCEVPDGYTAVIRDLDVMFFESSGPAGLQLLGTEGQVIWEVEAAGDADYAYPWRGRQVFNAGETIGLQSILARCDVTLSGYLLSGEGPG